MVSAALPAKSTELLWDRYGIPHIFAPDHASLFHSYGYARMEAHAELLVRLYAQSRGHGAECYGKLQSSVREGGESYVDTIWALLDQVDNTRHADPSATNASGQHHRARSAYTQELSRERPGFECL